MAQLHPYEVEVTWTGGRDGGGTAVNKHSGHQAPINVPTEFQGPGGGTNPEEMLTAAIASCYSITLGIITANRKLPIVDIKTEAHAEVEQAGMQFTYKTVVLKPTIRMAAETTDEQKAAAEDMAHKADAYCIITNAVRGKVEITIEPTIIIG